MFKKFLQVFAFAMVLVGCASTKLTSKEQLAMSESLNDRRFAVDVESVFPNRGGIVNVSSGYSVEVRGDTLVSNLPFFGRAYGVPLGVNKVLNFTAPISEYEDKVGKRDSRQIRLVVDNEEDVITYWFEIETNGSAHVKVMPRKREGISYGGEIPLHAFK